MGGFAWLARRPAAAGDPTHALFAAQSHSIVDNLVALFEHSRAYPSSVRNVLEKIRCPFGVIVTARVPSMRQIHPCPKLWAHRLSRSCRQCTSVQIRVRRI